MVFRLRIGVSASDIIPFSSESNPAANTSSTGEKTSQPTVFIYKKPALWLLAELETFWAKLLLRHHR
jgi:hypothetical protein